MIKETDTIIEKIDISIESGLNYLEEHQLPNGEFVSYYSPDDAMKEWCVPDSIVFFTSLIATCLLPLMHNTKVSRILTSAEVFLRYQMMRGGVWNYFTKWNPLFKYSPADLDDTVFALHVLKSLNSDFTNSNASILANRNSNGLFYTWFVVRIKKKYDRNYLRIIIRELKRPIHSILFWFKHEGKRNDIDAVVNANVLYYLGLNETTQPIVDYLIEVVSRNKESDADKWYKNPVIIYYFISRNYKQAKKLDQIKDSIVTQIFDLRNDDGSFGKSDMDTALAISILVNFEVLDERLQPAIEFLIESQARSGHWARNIFFYAGPKKIVGWGSEEVTTAYCIEALFGYQQFLRKQDKTLA